MNKMGQINLEKEVYTYNLSVCIKNATAKKKRGGFYEYSSTNKGQKKTRRTKR